MTPRPSTPPPDMGLDGQPTRDLSLEPWKQSRCKLCCCGRVGLADGGNCVDQPSPAKRVWGMVTTAGLAIRDAQLSDTQAHLYLTYLSGWNGDGLRKHRVE